MDEKTTRFSELYSRGWKFLNHAERGEWKSLKAELGDPKLLFNQNSPASVDVAPKPSGVFTMTQEELSRLLADAVKQGRESAQEQVAGLEAQVGIGTWRPQKKPIERTYTAKMRTFQKDIDSPVGVIINQEWDKKPRWNEETHRYDKMVYRITLRYDGGETEIVEMPLEDLAKISDFIIVKILKQKETPMEQIQGYTNKSYNSGGYRMSGLVIGASGSYDKFTRGERVPLTVTTSEWIATIELPNKEVIEIPTSKLN